MQVPVWSEASVSSPTNSKILYSFLSRAVLYGCTRWPSHVVDFFLLMFQIKILQFKNNNNINLLSLKKKLKRIYFFSFKKNVEMLDLDFIKILLKKKKRQTQGIFPRHHLHYPYIFQFSVINWKETDKKPETLMKQETELQMLTIITVLLWKSLYGTL